MRTQDEIVAHIRDDKSLFNFAGEALVCFLDFEHAKPFLVGDATEAAWDEQRTPFTEEAVRSALADYMDFAWGKVEDHRGISASRSVDKCSSYVWLLGDDATLAAVEAAGYAQYGAPKLAVICAAYGLPIPSDEAVQRMIRGEACGSYDACGCG